MPVRRVPRLYINRRIWIWNRKFSVNPHFNTGFKKLLFCPVIWAVSSCIVDRVKINRAFLLQVCFLLCPERKQWRIRLAGGTLNGSLFDFEITSIKMFKYAAVDGSTRCSYDSFPLVAVSVTAIIWHQFQNGAKVCWVVSGLKWSIRARQRIGHRPSCWR
jgi:hypothetical protein